MKELRRVVPLIMIMIIIIMTTSVLFWFYPDFLDTGVEMCFPVRVCERECV